MYSSAGGPQGPSPSGKGVTQMAYHMILDTETCDRYARKTNQPEPWNSLVYDLGFCVVDMATGETVERKSIVIAETFNNSRLMNSAYYAGKLPQYRAGISMDEGGEWQMLDCLTAYNLMRDTIRKYGIRKVWAYNAKFDQQALNSTVRTYSNSFCGFWLPTASRCATSGTMPPASRPPRATSGGPSTMAMSRPRATRRPAPSGSISSSRAMLASPSGTPH